MDNVLDQKLAARIQRLQSDRHFRDTQRLFVAEGIRSVLRMNAESVEAVVWSPTLLRSSAGYGWLHQRGAEVPCYSTSPERWRSLSVLPRASGILAIGRQRHLTGDCDKEIHSTAVNCWTIVDRIRSGGNLGTLIRTAAAVGSGLVVCSPGVDLYAPSVIRASMGGFFQLPIVRCRWSEFLHVKQRTGMTIVGACPEASQLHTEYQPRRGELTGLLLGEERRGLTRRQRRACDARVRILMVNTTDSLNVGVAAGILLYELGRQLGFPCSGGHPV